MGYWPYFNSASVILPDGRLIWQVGGSSGGIGRRRLDRGSQGSGFVQGITVEEGLGKGGQKTVDDAFRALGTPFGSQNPDKSVCFCLILTPVKLTPVLIFA